MIYLDKPSEIAKLNAKDTLDRIKQLRLEIDIEADDLESEDPETIADALGFIRVRLNEVQQLTAHLEGLLYAE